MSANIFALYRDLGLMDYRACWQLQQRLFDQLMAHKVAEKGAKESTPTPTEEQQNQEIGTIIMVEHPPVYTLGKSGKEQNLLIDFQSLEALGAQFFHIDRGGDVTFHGPGQIVCYPILDLEKVGIGLREYIFALEEAVIRTVAHYGIQAQRVEGASGVWIVDQNKKQRKICAIGVRASRYVTMHGLALNVGTDLSWFSKINPCGFTDKGVTSIEQQTGKKICIEQVKELLRGSLEKILNVKIYNN